MIFENLPYGLIVDEVRPTNPVEPHMFEMPVCMPDGRYEYDDTLGATLKPSAKLAEPGGRT